MLSMLRCGHFFLALHPRVLYMHSQAILTGATCAYKGCRQELQVHSGSMHAHKRLHDRVSILGIIGAYKSTHVFLMYTPSAPKRGTPWQDHSNIYTLFGIVAVHRNGLRTHRAYEGSAAAERELEKLSVRSDQSHHPSPSPRMSQQSTSNGVLTRA